MEVQECLALEVQWGRTRRQTFSKPFTVTDHLVIVALLIMYYYLCYKWIDLVCISVVPILGFAYNSDTDIIGN